MTYNPTIDGRGAPTCARCCQNNVHHFGTIENGAMILNKQAYQYIENNNTEKKPNKYFYEKDTNIQG